MRVTRFRGVGLKTGIGNEKLYFHWQGLVRAVGMKAHPSLPTRLPEIIPRDGGTISSAVEDEEVMWKERTTADNP